MYKEKKFFGLLALLLMGCGSMVAQSKLAPMVSAYVQQAKTRRAASAEEQKPGLFMVNVQADANPDEVSTQITERGAEVDGKEVDGSLFDTPDMILDTLQLKQTNTFHGVHVAGCAAASPVVNVKGTAGGSLAGLQRGVYAVQIGRLGSTLIRL